MKTAILTTVLILSSNAFAANSISLTKALQEIAYGRKDSLCKAATEGSPALARALRSLELEDQGIATRIGHDYGQENAACLGTLVMPYTFKTKDGKLTVELNEGQLQVTDLSLKNGQRSKN
jgi:hypothetical protein